MRRHYIDNLRWMTLLILIPYHAAMAWNCWGEPNYITLEGSRVLSSLIVFFSPFFMPLLFVLAGISTKYALQKRTCREYLSERTKKLLVPFLFGTVVLMPVMTYLADRFNCGYDGGFFEHYGVFFGKFTDLTGADGGFSLGQFWFLLYLFVISAVSVLIIRLIKRIVKTEKALPFPAVILLGLPLPILSDLLSIGGKSLIEYTYLFLLGYYIFSDDGIIKKAEKYRWATLFAGLVSGVLDVYLFLWSDAEHELLNNAAKYISEWFMILALLGLSKRYLDFDGKISAFMKARSFLFFIYHFICVVLLQYLLYPVLGGSKAVFYTVTVLGAYIMTFAFCEISIRIPFLCLLTGTKCIGKK